MACLLLTRPRASAESFATAAGWVGDLVISPVLRVVFCAVEPPAPDEAVIVTSQYGVDALVRATDHRDWPVWCVGPRCLEAARAAGFCNLNDGGGTAQSLFDRLCNARPDRVLVHMRGTHVVTDLTGRLNAAGLRARAVPCYDQQAKPLNATARACLQAPGTVFLPVFSPRSAAIFAQEWRAIAAPQAQLHAVAISPAAASGLESVPTTSVHIADTPDQPGMLAALARAQAALEPDQNPR